MMMLIIRPVNQEKVYISQNPVKPILIQEELLHPVLNN